LVFRVQRSGNGGWAPCSVIKHSERVAGGVFRSLASTLYACGALYMFC
jgi:hypothetical protein